MIAAFGKFGAAVAAGFISGGIATGSLKGAFVGAFSAGVFNGIGSAFEADGWAKAFFGAAAGGAKLAAHGVAGGVMSVLNGGKFGNGFVSAGLTQALAPGINGIDKGARFSPGRIMAAAAVGGTASAITGGKFANGAVTGAFSRAFNDEMHPQREARKSGYQKVNPFKVISEELPGAIGEAFDAEMELAARAARKSILKGLPDDQGVKLSVSGGVYIGGSAELVFTNEGIVFSRGAGRVFGLSGGVSYVLKNALATDGVTSWSSSISLGPVEASYELNMQNGASPQVGFDASPSKLGFSIGHTLMKHTHYKGE